MRKKLPVTHEAPSILNPLFKYIPAAATDIRKTWQKFGFKPPSENKPLDKSQDL